MEKEWFSHWFDSPYYHILYQNRDDDEAQLFIDKLSEFLGFLPEHQIMDLACGKGRHSIYLNQKGFNVTGLDLSPQSIEYAQQFANERLHFHVHDMRDFFAEREFDFVLNMFTSFGYLANESENIKAFQSAARSLKKGGRFVLDFFNTPLVIRELVSYEIKSIEGIDFEIRKRHENGCIIKNIDFEAEKHHYHFQERVEAICQESFLRYFSSAGLTLKHLFGNYLLEPYQAESSSRMIFILEK
ncbi:Methyltransferase domain-containing protein [Pseudarcicella hirudinis]|uniref:Methyltransferase domain-containing protein n=2 Tax=Pseudarcicella hirudinis TaxID=1079859 RepID=A0A1I5XLN9_9BACT|nr:class I SAM-dependent methyltransferase [Pseudarcicella hirudinis]SFQ32820.1 Methyltransferase domain-containing protein [Pseudarcicella hirudinis]